MENITIRPEIEALETLFDRVNDRFFAGQLERAVITLAPGMRLKKGVNFGWFTTWRAWKAIDETAADGVDGYYEINISSDALQRPLIDIVCTMAHEMVHMLNKLGDIQDCSRGGKYHNKRFKASAEQRGLIIDLDPKYGWSKTSPAPEMIAFAAEQADLALTLARTREVRPDSAAAKKPYKYQCPRCGAKVTSRHAVRLFCGCGDYCDENGKPFEPLEMVCTFNPDAVDDEIDEAAGAEAPAGPDDETSENEEDCEG